MFKVNINVLKNIIVFRSLVNRSKFFKIDVFVVRFCCGRGVGYLDGCRRFFIC